MSDIAQPRGLRALYAWMLKNAQGRHAWAALASFAFAEASFFPIPADVMLLPMMVADRKRAFRLGAWCAFWSVMGGMLGYAIGALFWETAGLWLIHVLHMPLAQVEALRAKATPHHAYLIMVQGATPIPYKLVTIASGLAGVPFPLFMLYSAITRSLALYRAGRRCWCISSARRPKRCSRNISKSRWSCFWSLVVLGFVAAALSLDGSVLLQLAATVL